MSRNVAATIMTHFGNIEDPRRGPTHSLEVILVIALCAVTGGADGWVGVEGFAKAKAPWLAKFLDLSKGIPSHDTWG